MERRDGLGAIVASPHVGHPGLLEPLVVDVHFSAADFDGVSWQPDDALDQKVVDRLSKMYNLIEVSESEQFSMGTNVLSIGQNRVLSLPVNIDVNHQMRQRGFEVLEVDFSEIIKSGGSFRCCSMPIVRH